MMKTFDELKTLNYLPLLLSRKEEISKLIEIKEKDLQKSPEGELRISMEGQAPQYFFRHKGGDFNGLYLKHPNKSLIQALAQKSYDEKVLRNLKQELLLLQKIIKFYQTKDINLIYSKMHTCRQKLVTPVTYTFEEYAKMWLNVSYKKNPYEIQPKFETLNGNLVRSKSEVLIANSLSASHIPFLYEYPLQLSRRREIFPDFTCLHPTTRAPIIWEHFGLMDDPDYATHAVQKLEAYTAAGYSPGKNFIITFETSSDPLTPQAIIQTISNNFIA